MAFVTVTGTIGRTFYEGKGAEVVESWEQRGEKFSKRWSAFFDEAHGLEVGAEVTVTGVHSDKVDSYEKEGETRTVVKRTINKAKVKGTSSTPPVVEPADDWSQPQPTPDVWSTDSYTETSTPF